MSKSSREHELFQELRAARRDRAAALEDEEEARRVAAEKKAVRRKFDLLIEEILDEIETGKRRDSLIEYAESRAEAAEAEDTADERQRGPTSAPPAKAPARKPERADRRTAGDGDQAEFAEAFDPCDLHEGSWRDTKLRDVIKSKNLLKDLFRYDTLGCLVDAAKEEGGLYNVLDLDLVRLEMIEVEHDLSAWVRKYPKGFPAELLEDLRDGLEPKAPAEDRSDKFVYGADVPGEAEAERPDEYFDAALAAACWPEGANPDWTKHRKFGSISDREVGQVLKSTWPARHVHTPDEGAAGWTTYGGDAPVFWVGDQSGKGPKPLGLHGPNLADAIRRVLRIPSPSGAPRLPGSPAEPPAPPASGGKAKKPRKSKAAAAAAE